MEASGGRFGEDEPFEISSSPETADSDPVFEGANVCRVAALSTMLGGDSEAIRDLAAELAELGFADQLTLGERPWRDIDPLEAFAGLQGGEASEERVQRWRMINERLQPSEAIAFLVAVLGSGLERESAAAASALWRHIAGLDNSLRRGGSRFPYWIHLFDLLGWEQQDGGRWDFPWLPGFFDLNVDGDDRDISRWDPEIWAEIYRQVTSGFGDPFGNIFLISFLSRWRLERALRSPDPVTRSLAMAASLSRTSPGGVEDAPMPPSTSHLESGAPAVSTMIHGTAGYVGDWWEPSGDFHDFIRANHRSNLYSEGAPFSWDGWYLGSHREVAAKRFGRWAGTMGTENGLQTVFAHSYGGDIAAMAVLAGTRVNELVLLSVPVTRYINEVADTNVRVVDVRLRFDPVLALARTRQRLRSHPNATTVLLKRWRFDHGASHNERVWQEEEVGKRGRI